MTAFSFVLSILDLIHTHSSLKTHQSRDRVLFMGGVTELYLSPVSDTHVCSTLSRLHYAPTLTVVHVPVCIVPVSV